MAKPSKNGSIQPVKAPTLPVRIHRLDNSTVAGERPRTRGLWNPLTERGY